MEDLKVFTDDILVRLYADGNNEAFDVLLERYQNRIYSYIQNIVKDRDLANDLFQETFVKAIVTINLAIDYFRQAGAVTQISCDNEDLNILNRKDLSEATIEDNIVREQILSDVKQLVLSLPDVQKQVLEMRYYLNMSFKEIAEATGVSINTALGRMRYALMNLRKIAEENHIVLTM